MVGALRRETGWGFPPLSMRPVRRPSAAIVGGKRIARARAVPAWTNAARTGACKACRVETGQ